MEESTSRISSYAHNMHRQTEGIVFPIPPPHSAMGTIKRITGFLIMHHSCLSQDKNLSSRRGGTTSVWDSGIGGFSSAGTSNFATQLEGEVKSKTFKK